MIEIDNNWYNDIVEEIDKHIDRFIERYNKKRIHSSIGYVTPEEFEQSEGRF